MGEGQLGLEHRGPGRLVIMAAALFFFYNNLVELLRSIYLNVNVVEMQQKRKQNDKKLQKYSIVSK